MKRFAIALFFAGMFMGTSVLNAQELKINIIEDLKQDSFDMTAKEENRNDGDGHAYAIIKVTSDIEDDDLNKFKFNFGNMKSVKENHDGELWIYVPRNTKWMDISRDGYKSIRRYEFDAIKEGTTYTMKLSVQTPKVKYRVLEFKVEPANENAIVKVKPENEQENYEIWGSVDVNGSINRRVETGVYLYEVSADYYLSSQGRVILTPSADGENFVENVTLTPNHGYLEIDDSHGIAGAEVYIDEKKVGEVPFRSQRMECRDDYKLMIIGGEFYKPFTDTIAITSLDTTKLSPMLEANFATTTIKVDGEAEIFIDGEGKGRGSWSGPLRAGSYDIECRLPNHTSTTKQIKVIADVSKTFLMDMPTPIVGSLYINTNPSGAKIIIDGKDEKFVTPREVGGLLIGPHKVTLTLDNHRTETREVDIREGETAEIDVELSKTENVVDEPINEISQQKGTTSDNRKYQKKNQFYLQAMYQAGGYSSVGGAIGFFAGNVNFEADYFYGLDTETIYWNYYSRYPDEDKLSSMYIGGKIGYGFVTGKRIRITPQIGGGLLRIMGDHSDSYSVNGTLGIRCDLAIANHISIVAVPEYSLSLKESDTFKNIADVSSMVKGWANGFNIRLGMSIYF